MKITVQNKGVEVVFDCDAREAILHAGLRQGLELPYECATGTCGTCRARVVSGDFDMRWKEAPGAARLKPEKGDILMCQTLARSDCVLKVPAEIRRSAQSAPAVRDGVIRNVRQLTHDVAQFDVHLSGPMTFEAGQFVLVECPELTGGRAYSMVNFEPETDRAAFVLKQKPGGGFSDWLARGLGDDRKVKIFGPLGRAVFRPGEGKNMICIAGGSGIAGMMSILERAVRADYFLEHKGLVCFGVRKSVDLFYLEALGRYAEASHGNLEVVVALSDEPTDTAHAPGFPSLKLASGMVHEVAAARIAEYIGDAIAYVAGPPVMVDAAVRSLIKAGVPVRDIRYDKFG